jgi:hypothetical protein
MTHTYTIILTKRLQLGKEVPSTIDHNNNRLLLACTASSTSGGMGGRILDRGVYGHGPSSPGRARKLPPTSRAAGTAPQRLPPL